MTGVDWKRWEIWDCKSGLDKVEKLTSVLEELENSALQEWIGKGGEFDEWIGKDGSFVITRVDWERRKI